MKPYFSFFIKHETDPNLEGWNCRHSYFPFFSEISVRAYTDEQLKNIDNPPFTYEGKRYTHYEATQRQRELETAMRKTKREIIAYDATGLPMQLIRAEQYGFGKSISQKVIWVRRKEIESEKLTKAVANKEEFGILNKEISKEAIDVDYVGKIDKQIYSCITKDITTDEVIITDNQKRHILNRHSESYEEVIQHFNSVLKSPDYIIKDKNKNTGLVIKQIDAEEKHTQIVLRIHTSSDTSGHKNSIISSWIISDKRLRNYLRNKSVLYTKE